MDITCKNLWEFCRLCLRNLKDGNISGNISYNLREIPEMKKFLQCLTALKSFEIDNEQYPKNLCELCYEKLIDIQEFRCMILNSAQRIESILKSANRRQNTEQFETQQAHTVYNEDSDDDNKLLLPDLKDWMNNVVIKTEPTDLNESDVQLQQKFDVQVKNEIDSDCEQDDQNQQYNDAESIETSDDNSTTNEENALTSGNVYTVNFREQNLEYISSSNNKNMKLQKRDRNKKSLKCPRCNKQVYKKVYLDAHIRSVHEGQEKPFQCEECQKAFTRYNQLQIHIQSNHVMAIKFFCDFVGCDASFKMSQTLETHRKVAHTSLSSAATIQFEKIFSLKHKDHNLSWDNFCSECGKNFSSKRALTEHLKRHAQIKEHICQVCGVGKVTRTELLTHMRTHESNLEKFKCSQCPQEFNHKNAISRHVRVVHEGERKFHCSYCPRRFSTRNSKVCHERLHTGERPFQCTACPKGFAQIEGLKSHMKNHDKNLRKHVCSVCSQRFITRKNLEHHEQRHYGNKPHICINCGRGFYKAEDLEIHMKSHMNEGTNNIDSQGKPLEEDSQLHSDQSNDTFESNDIFEKTEPPITS